MARCFQHELDHLDGTSCSSASTPTSARRPCKLCASATSLARGRRPSPLGRPTPCAPRLPRHARRRRPALRALVDAGHDVALVVTQPDRSAGPRQRPRRQPGEGGRARARPARHRSRSTTCSTPAPSSAWSSPSASSSSPTCSTRVPMVNVHFSLLPRWRGAAPVERAILAGDARDRRVPHGADEGLDTGPVYRLRRARRSAPTRRPTSCATAWSASARRLLVDALRTRARRAGAPGGRADLRGQDRARRAPPRLGPARRVVLRAWCGSAGRGRRSAASACVSTRATRRRPAAAARRTVVGPATASASAARCSRRARARMAGGGLAQRRPPAARRTCRLTRRRPRLALEALARHRRGRLRQPRPCPRCSTQSASSDRDRAFVTELVVRHHPHAPGVRLAGRPLRLPATVDAPTSVTPCASAPTSWRSCGRRRTPPWARRSTSRPSARPGPRQRGAAQGRRRACPRSGRTRPPR